MKNSTKALVLLLLLNIYTSCGILKNRNVKLEKKNSEVALSVDSASKVSEVTVDKTRTVITEKAKGVGYTAPVKTEFVADLSAILSGLRIVRDSGLVKITQSFNEVTKQIQTDVEIKPMPVTYDVNKSTTIDNDIKKETLADRSFKKDSVANTSSKTKITESKTSVKTMLLFGFIAVLVVAAVYFYLKK